MLCKVKELTVFLLLFVVASLHSVWAQTPAFPGAEGFGKYTQGGRGGRVIEVTNLDAPGPGSLRQAAEVESGPRIIVFRVGGTIDLLGQDIKISNPFVTIAGQTAPGDGIALQHGGIRVHAAETIIRYMRIRPGDTYPNTSGNGVAIFPKDGPAVSNVIVDHSSLSWGIDDLFMVVYGATSITLQWNLLAENLSAGQVESTGEYCRRGQTGCDWYWDGKGFLIGYGSNQNVTSHHNLMVRTAYRHPDLTGGNLDWVNNVSYDNPVGYAVDVYPMHAPARANFVGNYYKTGPNTVNPDHANFRFSMDTYGSQSLIHFSGNISPHRLADSEPQLADVKEEDGGLPWSSARLDFPLVTTTDAFTAYDQVVANAGATLPKRDAVDIRVTNNVLNGTSSGPSGQWLTHPSDVGGWPVLANGTPPIDTDHDGMPDAWELANGLNPNDPSDGQQDKDGDGYTNVEEYLNDLAGNSTKTAVSPTKPGSASKSIASQRVKQCPLDIFGRTINESSKNSKKQTLAREIMNRKLGQTK